MPKLSRGLRQDSAPLRSAPIPRPDGSSAGAVARAASWGAWLALGATLVSTVLLRLRLLGVPLERDEGEYAYMAQLIRQGEVPYLAAHNMKLPGVYYAYAGIFGLFGETDVAIHIGLLLINLVSIVLVYQLGRALLDATTGVIAGATWAVLSLSASVSGAAANAEHFVVAPVLAAVLLLAQPGERRRLGRIAGAGVLLGVAFVMKQHAAAFVAFGGLSVMLAGWQRGHAAWRRTAIEMVVVTLAALAPFGLLCLAMYRAGAFAPFWFWTFTYAREYVSMIPLGLGLEQLRLVGGRMLAASPALWILTASGVAALGGQFRTWRSGPFLALFVTCSVLAVATGLRFSDHYFILLLPAASLLAGAGVGALAGSRTARRQGVSGGGSAIVRVAVPLAAILLTLARGSAYVFSRSPTAVSRAVYGANPFPEAVEVARYLREHSLPDDRVAVIGSEPEIYFYARRRAATSYMYMYPLMEPQPFARQMQDEMIAEIERARPRFMVLVNVDTSWSLRPDSSRRVLDWAANAVNDGYRTVGLAEIMPDGSTRYRWGDEASGVAPRSRFHLVVFERAA